MDSGIPKVSRRRPMPACSLVAFKQKSQHNIWKTLGNDSKIRQKNVKKLTFWAFYIGISIDVFVEDVKSLRLGQPPFFTRQVSPLHKIVYVGFPI